MKVLEGIKMGAYNAAKLFTSYVEKAGDRQPFNEWLGLELGALRARITVRNPDARLGGVILLYPEAGETEMYTTLDQPEVLTMLADVLAMHAETHYGTPTIVELRKATDEERRLITEAFVPATGDSV